jgi:ABC-type phosphate/phosphonate transport system ATPase subunit
VEVHEQEYVQANVFEIVSEWLSTFCARANLGSDTMVDSALVEVQLAQNRLADAQKRLVALNSELLTLEAQGLSMAHAEEISAQLNELGYQFEEWSPGALDQLAIVISGALSTISRDVETVEKLIEESRQISAAALGLNDSDIAELQSTLSRKKDNLDMAESLRSGLRPFCLMFPWPGDRAFAEFLVEAQSIREIAAQLASTLDKETQAEISNTETIRSRETIEEKIADLRLKIDRLTDAKNVFAELKENHSLKNAMESVLQQNRTGIEIIFSRIHSPQEFQGLGSKLTTLFRKADGTEADLSRISTGQRTAFALSIFLAQNAQITEAPPVILIDDPLAHIDDLNALSFLDYLRELALLGKRQIFFTTADDKLASLFERKFDFLNTDFQRHDLSR